MRGTAASTSKGFGAGCGLVALRRPRIRASLWAVAGLTAWFASSAAFAQTSTPPQAASPADAAAAPSPSNPSDSVEAAPARVVPPPPVPLAEPEPRPKAKPAEKSKAKPVEKAPPATKADAKGKNDSSQEGTSRQYYSDWQENAAEKYLYKYFYFKPDPSATDYVRQYVCYYPTRPDYLYYYDPKAKRFWGRLLRNPIDEARRFSYVPVGDRRAKVGDIPEPAYTDLGPLPVLPGAKDGARMKAPTDREATAVPEPTPEDDVPVGTVVVEQPTRKIIVPPRPNLTIRVAPVPKPPFREEIVTVLEDRWVPQVTYAQINVGGRSMLVPVRNGYWTTVAVKKKVLVPN